MDGVPSRPKRNLTSRATKQPWERASWEKAQPQQLQRVQRLLDAGAIPVGKTNMHEIGIGVTGFNPHHGTPRNPYNLNHHTGGSSSGAGAAVAAGLGPIAIGADGEGRFESQLLYAGLLD